MPPPMGIECVPERIEKRPVRIAERLGRALRLDVEVGQPRSFSREPVDAGRRRTASDAAAIAPTSP